MFIRFHDKFMKQYNSLLILTEVLYHGHFKCGTLVDFITVNTLDTIEKVYTHSS